MKSTTERQIRDHLELLGSHDASIPEDEAFWREYLGEFLDARGVHRLLDLGGLQRLDELVAAHMLLAVPTARGPAFPKFQFVRGEIDPTIARVVKIFSSVVATPYTTAPRLRGARFDGKTVTEWVESGENPEVVIQAAEESAARLAA